VRDLFQDQSKPNLFELDGASMILTSNAITAIIYSGKLLLFDNQDFTILKEFEHEMVSQISFSPNNKYVVIIQKPTVVSNNLNVVSLSSFETILSLRSQTHPNSIWPQIRFSSDEKYLFKNFGKALEVHEIGESFELNKLGEIEDVVSFEITNINSEEHNIFETVILCGRAVQDKKNKNKKKSYFAFYRISDLSKPIKSFSISICDDIRIDLSKIPSVCLVHSMSDTSHTNYYGDSSLYIAEILFGTFTKVTPKNDGPIIDYRWLDDGKNFIMINGHQPAHLSVYDSEGCFVELLGKYKVNTISISPDNRIACIAGFGNLKGDILFFDLMKKNLIGQAFLNYGGDLCWSPDSKFMIAAVLSPRLRVDNEFIVVSYNGEPIYSEKFDIETFEVKWLENKSIKAEQFEIIENPNAESKRQESSTLTDITSSLSSISLNTNLLNKSSKQPIGAMK